MVSKAWLAPILVAAVAATFIAFLGGTITDLGPWYQALAQPSWAPPRAAFGVIWTAIFALTATAAVAAWRAAPDSRSADWLIGLFALNGALNILWSILFFRLHKPDWALLELVFLWLSVAALIRVCLRHSRIAALLLLPYLVWVTIAGLLNYEIVRMNGPFG